MASAKILTPIPWQLDPRGLTISPDAHVYTYACTHVYARVCIRVCTRGDIYFCTHDCTNRQPIAGVGRAMPRVVLDRSHLLQKMWQFRRVFSTWKT